MAVVGKGVVEGVGDGVAEGVADGVADGVGEGVALGVGEGVVGGTDEDAAALDEGALVTDEADSVEPLAGLEADTPPDALDAGPAPELAALEELWAMETEASSTRAATNSVISAVQR